MLREGLIHLSQSDLARRFVTRAPGSRAVARRFVAGESVDDAIAAVERANRAGMSATLDLLGESVQSREEARTAADIYMRVLERIAAGNLDANISLKLTQLGQDVDESFLHENLRRLLDRARERGTFVRLDMESSDYTERTLDFFERIWLEGYDNVGVVLQSYLYRTESDVRRMNELGVRVRLCKGAYNEPENVAFPRKEQVDDNFVHCMKLLLAGGSYPGIATHDERMIAATRRFARENGIDPSRFEFQMLYGVRRDLQQRLVRDGYGMRVYIPFGDAWYPYLMRRMAERPANLFFVLNNVIRESPLGGLLRRNGADGSR